MGPLSCQEERYRRRGREELVVGGGFLQQVAKISHIHRMSLRCYGPNRNQERKKKSETHFRAWGGRKVWGGGALRAALTDVDPYFFLCLDGSHSIILALLRKEI